METNNTPVSAAVRPPVSRREKIAICCLVFILAIYYNHQFSQWCALPTMLKMNDVKAILFGYYQTPHLIPDGLRWWSGSWIQQGITAYRPLSANLYWVECYIGLHWGFFWTACLGFVLFYINCLVSAAWGWRLTNSRLGMYASAVLATQASLFNACQPPYWLAWFPVHQELAMNACLLGGLLCFDVWLEVGKKRYLAGAWLLFVVGCFFKEHVYIFPVFALAAVVLRRGGAVTKSWALLQPAVMLASVGALWIYRASVLLHPRNPKVKMVILGHKPLLFMYNALGRYMITEQYWLPGFALLLFVLIVVRCRNQSPRRLLATVPEAIVGPIAFVIVLLVMNWVLCALVVLYLLGMRFRCQKPRWLWRVSPEVITGTEFFWVMAAVVSWVYLSLSYGPPAVALMFIFEQPFSQSHAADLFLMMMYCYSVYLLWKYRATEPTTIAWSFLFLAYAPVFSFIGWHYTLPAWFIRAPYDVLVVKLIWIDWGRPGAEWLEAGIELEPSPVLLPVTT